MVFLKKKGLFGNGLLIALLFITIILLVLSAIRIVDILKKKDANAPNQNGSLDTPVPGKTCSDGTLYGKCSLQAPMFCSDGKLVSDCVSCGCRLNQECDKTTGQCKPKTVSLAEECLTVEGTRGRTGPKAVEKVLLKWDFESINEKTCDASSNASFFCDPTQFSISLAYRLKGIAEKSIDQNSLVSSEEFESFLIADNFSEDFQKDFAFYYQNTFFETPSWFNSSPMPWVKYFSDTKRLVFSPRDILGQGSGLYKVRLLFEFEGNNKRFFDNGEPTAKITVFFEKKGDFEGEDSAFYHLPLNGMVGTNRQDEDGKTERKDYGTGFTEKQPRIVFAKTKSGDIDSSAKSGKNSFAVVVLDTFAGTNNKAGFVAQVNPKNNLIIFSPNYAVALVAGIRLEKGSGGIFYRIFEGFEAQGATLNHLAYWTTVGPLKAGSGFYGGKPLELEPDAKIGDSVQCYEITPEQKKEVFGLQWQNAVAGEKVLVESFLFIPFKKRLLVESVCSDPTFVFATSTQAMSGATKKMELSESALKISEFYELVGLVKEKDVCVVDWGGGEIFYWNSNSLRAQEGSAISLALERLGSGQTTPSLYPSAFLQSFSQSQQLNKSFSSDSLVPFNTGKPVYGLSVTGKATLSKENSIIRVIMVDSKGKEFLAFEAVPLVNGTGSFSFENVCEETCALNGIMPSFLKIQASNAQIELALVSFSTDPQRISPALMPQGLQAYSQQLKSQQEDYKIQKINEEIKKKGLKWIAGKTKLSQLSYEEKKALFMEPNEKGALPYLHGFEYCASGSFETGEKSVSPTLQSRFPEKWDWRERHGANNPSSPYYMGQNGWLSSIKNQGDCGSCWAFSTIAALESTANLYANKNLNLDLSEQELLSCSSAGSPEGPCKGGFINSALEYIKNKGVSSEQCMPYQATFTECQKCAESKASLVKIGSFASFESNEAVKEAIIKKGPLAAAIWFDAAHSAKSHAMAVIGWRNLEDGQIEWLFKDSTGLGSLESGYYRIIMPWGFRYAYTVLPPISIGGNEIQPQCFDFDKDGYCNWGLSEKKPSSCPASCKEEKDCDDSNPALGPFDEKFNCKPLFAATHKECVNNACVEVAGEGADKCQDSSQCGQKTHKECVSGKCSVVAGEGADQCQTDSQCVVATRKVCQNNQCIEVPGSGASECSSNEQCIPAKPGIIMVKSNPRALVFLDGASYGMTPLLGDWGKIENVSPGKHTIKLEREGFMAKTLEVSLASGQTVFVEETLSPA
ncbi:MAG: C1 family peptidase [Candidatus Diapherotrites archaeon]